MDECKLKKKVDSFKSLTKLIKKMRTNISQLNQHPNVQPLSNAEQIKEQFKYTKQYQSRLDEADRLILPLFNFQAPLTEKVLHQIQEHIVQTCHTVVSISFKFLKQEKFTDSEAKVYAAKNILLNVRSIMTKFSSLVQKYLPEQTCKLFLWHLTNEIDAILKNTFTELAPSLPPAPTTGVSLRMRQAIKSVSRSQDETKDLIYNHNIRITNHLNLKENRQYDIKHIKEEDYIGFIMQVINKAINITRQSKDDKNDITIYERFCQFNQKIILLANKPNFKDIPQHLKQAYLSEYLTVRNQLKQKDLQWLRKMTEEESEQLQKLKKQQKFSFGTKIPSEVKPFTKNELKQKIFHVNSSSILRIMTKWVQYLQDIFINPQKQIRQRTYPFKDIHHKLIDANTENLKQKLIQNIKKQYINVQVKLQKLKQSNTYFQSYLLSVKNEEPYTVYLKRFQEVRSAASQINFTLISVMQEYLATLIHHLLIAGKVSLKQVSHINLVIFRVADLMRSKLQCTKSTFINILNLLELLDEQLPQKAFKMVRIKNKLDDKDNNIIINYMFLGKVECELQLSIQELRKRQKHNYVFSHFLYQLTRGKFGVLSECAIIVSQYDSIISSCQEDYYRSKKRKIQPIDEAEEQKIELPPINAKSKERYICSKCKDLVFHENVKLYSSQVAPKVCNKCITSQQKSQEAIADKNLKRFISNHLQSKAIRKIQSYKNLKSNEFVLTLRNIGEKNKIMVSKAWYLQRQLKWYLVKINDDLYTNNQEQKIASGLLSYANITDKIKGKKSFDEPTYAMAEENFKKIQFKKEEWKDLFQSDFSKWNVSKGLDRITETFLNFRTEKDLVKLVKFNNEIIDGYNNVKKREILQKIIKDINQIEYKQYNQISFNFIKRINLACTQLQEIDLAKMTHLNYLNLQHNQLKIINLSSNTMLTQIILQDNKLTQFDFSKNSKLTTINLYKNSLKKIQIAQLQNLLDVDIKNNCLQSIAIINVKSPIRIQAGCQKNIKQLQQIKIASAPNIKQFTFDICPTLTLNNIKFQNKINPDCKFQMFGDAGQTRNKFEKDFFQLFRKSQMNFPPL